MIPLVVGTKATAIEISFLPDANGTSGTKAELRAQLVYRDKNGAPVYGPRVASGKLKLDLSGGARNHRVDLVVGVVNRYDENTNADYGYKLNERFGYQVKLGTDVALASNTVVPW